LPNFKQFDKPEFTHSCSKFFESAEDFFTKKSFASTHRQTRIYQVLLYVCTHNKNPLQALLKRVLPFLYFHKLHPSAVGEGGVLEADEREGISFTEILDLPCALGVFG